MKMSVFIQNFLQIEKRSTRVPDIKNCGATKVIILFMLLRQQND